MEEEKYSFQYYERKEREADKEIKDQEDRIEFYRDENSALDRDQREQRKYGYQSKYTTNCIGNSWYRARSRRNSNDTVVPRKRKQIWLSEQFVIYEEK